MKNSFETMFLEVLSVEQDNKKDRRIAHIVRNVGCDATQAFIVDDVCYQALRDAAVAIGRNIDRVDESLRAQAAIYALRVVNANLDQLENYIVGEAALLNSMEIRMADSTSDPECDCPSCTAVREAQQQVQTRH